MADFGAWADGNPDAYPPKDDSTPATDPIQRAYGDGWRDRDNEVSYDPSYSTSTRERDAAPTPDPHVVHDMTKLRNDLDAVRQRVKDIAAVVRKNVHWTRREKTLLKDIEVAYERLERARQLVNQPDFTAAGGLIKVSSLKEALNVDVPVSGV